MIKVSDSEIASALENLPGWILENRKLHREYRFEDFVHAFGFMSTAALVAEAAGHHPEWSNVYDTVTIDLITHEADGITMADLEMACKLEAIAKRLMLPAVH